jgi:hypothetical protein
MRLRLQVLFITLGGVLPFATLANASAIIGQTPVVSSDETVVNVPYSASDASHLSSRQPMARSIAPSPAEVRHAIPADVPIAQVSVIGPIPKVGRAFLKARCCIRSMILSQILTQNGTQAQKKSRSSIGRKA